MNMQSHDKQMPIMEHLIELRNRLTWAVLALFITFGVCYYFVEDIYGFLVQPLAEIMGPDRRMIYTALTEVFFTYVKVSFFAACFVSAPVFLGQFWAFVAPGLYKNERSAFMPFIFATPILFLMGGALVYYLIMPLAWKFFLSFEQAGGASNLAIQLEAKVGEYLSLVMKLIFAFGLCFQLPVLLTLMARAGIVTADGLARRRKYAIVIAFGFAAVLTPPDLISQIGLGIPIIILYEISIIMARISERKRAKAAADDDADEDDEADSDDDDGEAPAATGTAVATAQDGVDAQGEAAASYDDGQTSLTRSSDDEGDAPKLSGPSNNDDGEDDFNNAR
ncbi:MAG: twin-arginine translocase subunit TatC [Thalassospira sp.]|nr:twin-arginine translocase subunit TatC [Thalassospira sp.]MBO6820336.1 twin-arginine translocase subunit TatC [Thalassospira sp.]MBO6889652.1 twin-arginine translocase subunit TatC [Thalassospira sp.]